MALPNLLYGAHIGEHGFDPDTIIREIKENCVDRGMNFVTIRTGGVTLRPTQPIPDEYFLAWAKYLAENKIYFIFLYSMAIKNSEYTSQMSPALVQQMKEIAGEYFLGDMLGELGALFCGKMPGYYIKGHPDMPPQNVGDMQIAKDNYIKAVQKYMDVERAIGMDKIGVSVVESTTLSCYNLEAGTTIPLGELMGRDPEPLIATTRGSARAYGSPFWGTYIAHEWYAGHYHEDALKRKRLELEYKISYMSGTNVLCHESGDDVITAYGRELPRESEVSTECRRFIDDFGAFIKRDKRPDGAPVTKVAFMQGNLDSWTGKLRGSNEMGCAVWSQFGDKDWSYSTPEWSWDILSEMGKKRGWWEFDSYACHGKDLSAAPAYGSYDILPANAPVSALSRYDTIIYCGWNTMTEDQLSRLEQFVEQGGTLLMTAAHLNTSTKRVGEYKPVRGGDLSRLFGCKLTGERFGSDMGVKFRAESTVAGVQYPSSLDSYSDPLYALGYADYAKIEPCGATVVATLEECFHYFDQPGTPAILENHLGKGTAILMITVEYPGNNAIYPLYRFMVRELLRAGVECAKVRVCAPASVRHTVYEDGTVYLLNTDFDCAAEVCVMADSFEKRLSLAPLALERVDTGISV